MPKFFKFTIISTLLILTGCTPRIYNTPYIDAIETIQLEYQLTKNEVVNLFGKPLYVESGNNVNNEVFWIYEVRARSVKSDIIGNNIIPNKDHNDTKPTPPIHHLRITFIDGKVSSWQAIDKDKIEEERKEKKVKENIVEKSKPKLKKKKDKIPKKMFFHPKVGIDEIMGDYSYPNTQGWNDYHHHESTNLVLGAYFGLEIPKYRLGIDTKLGDNSGAMVIFEKLNLYKGINLIAGIGMYKRAINFTTKNYVTKTGNIKSNFKMGIAKTLILTGKPLTTNIGFLLGENNNGSLSISIAYHLK